MWPSQSGPLAKLIAHPCFRAFSPLLCCQPTKIFMLTHWRPATFGDSEKKHRNARGFTWEFLWSCKCYWSGWSVKRRGKSCSLHSKKIIWLGIMDLWWVTSQVEDFQATLADFTWPWAPTVRR